MVLTPERPVGVNVPTQAHPGITCLIVPPKKLSFRLSFSLSDMTNYKSAFGKVCRIKNRHTFKSMPILNSAYFTECRRHIVIPCGKVCRIKNRHTFRILPILKSAYFKSMPILNSSYHAVKYAELRIGSILKVCRFVIRHITQTETQMETEANFTHCLINSVGFFILNLILSDLAILCRFGLQNLKTKNGTYPQWE